MAQTAAASAQTHPSLAADWRDRGCALVRGLFTAGEVAELRDAFTELGRNGPVAGLSDGGGGDPTDPLSRWPRMMHPHRHRDQAWGRLAERRMLDPRIRSAFLAITGEDHHAAQSMFYFKPPGARGQALHQDNFYLRVSPGTCAAMWLALDDADTSNGGLEVVPGSHRHPIACPEEADHRTSFSGHLVRPPAGLSPEPVALKAGDVLFFHGALIHGSPPNRSPDRFRRAFICHYLPTTSREISRWYRPILDSAGSEVEFADATGGGPCGGGDEAKGPH
jgi:phytanoyl-CoA hydroxylase